MRPSRLQVCMEMAQAVSQRATCSLASVGVVIARDGRILSTGYNGAPAGMRHCEHLDDWDHSDPCDVSVHAEANAIAYAARWGISTEGAMLVSTHWCCLNCAKLIVNSGINRVVANHKYRDEKGRNLLESAGIVCAQYFLSNY